MAVTLLSGWGRTAPSAAHIVRPATATETATLLGDGHPNGRGIIARGLGRSYGDAAQNAGGTVLDVLGLDEVIDSDLTAGVITAGAGTSLDALMRWLVPRGWFVPVTPGTRFVTVGGAIAADIHGKNHHVDGSFGRHVTAITLATPIGIRSIGPSEDADLFWATVGGMGLTGVIIDATIRLLPIETAYVRVDTDRCRDLDDVMGRMEAGDAAYRYSVAWIDCVTGGRHLGRGVLTRGDHAGLDELPAARRPTATEFAPATRLKTPSFIPGGLVNRATVRIFNELWFLKAPRYERNGIQRLTTFFHPLDGVADWNRMYGRRGFVQYQFAVPFTAAEVVRRTIEELSRAGVPSFVAVLKRFGPGDAGPLSFPLEGWTLALDLPVGREDLSSMLDGFDELVASAGGRVYLAKDARLRPELLGVMYPRLAAWREQRQRVDPDAVLSSDLSRRLGL